MNTPRPTLDELVESHQRRLMGFMRCRVSDDATAEDLVQETWAEVLRHFPTFDESLGSFWVFTKIWAGFVLMRYWEERAHTPIPMEEPPEEAGDGFDNGGDASPFPRLGVSGMQPELAVDTRGTLLELLCRVMSSSRPPHEIVIFGLSRLEWKPREIVAQLSDQRLADLAVKIEEDYAAFAPSATIHVAFCPLRHKMSERLTCLVADPRTRGMYPHLLDRIVGETVLREYYPADKAPEEIVTRWWDSIKRAVAGEIARVRERVAIE